MTFCVFFRLLFQLPLLCLLILSGSKTYGFDREIIEGVPNIGISAYIASVANTDKLAHRAMNGEKEALDRLITVSLYFEPTSVSQAVGVLLSQTSLIRLIELQIINSTDSTTLGNSISVLDETINRKK